MIQRPYCIGFPGKIQSPEGMPHPWGPMPSSAWWDGLRWDRRGGNLPPGGFSWVASWAMHPPFSFRSCPKRKRAVHGPKEKNSFGRNFARACKVAVRGSAYRCKRRFGPAFGHAIIFCDSRDCRPVADGAGLVGVVVALSCFSFRCRSPDGWGWPGLTSVGADLCVRPLDFRRILQHSRRGRCPHRPGMDHSSWNS